jgi:hypothetical protein
MINILQFRVELIQKCLKPINLWSPKAEEILVMTAAQESLGGSFLRQFPTGPALGIFQIEENTINDIWDNYIAYNLSIEDKILRTIGATKRPPNETIIYNLWYAVLMVRVFYLRVKEDIPPVSDVLAMAAYYKKHFNSDIGKATIPEVIANYHKFIELQK